ncbi:MAG: extracellular solute-binding protein [Lachnospiraceae bacterium]|nr:extracellular solute-binding protein [Lachnospiraceae bacterium]
MKKRFLSIMLIAAMVLSLAACGKKEDTTKTQAQTQTQTQSGTDSKASTDTGAKQDTTQVSAQDIQATVNSGDVVKTNADCIVGNIPCKMPIADGTEMNILIRCTLTGFDDPSQIKVWQEYEKMTGIHVNWTDMGSDRKARVQQALMGEEDFDLILKGKIAQSSLIEYGQQGVILDFAEYLPQYAPNCWAYLQSHPDTLACIQSPEGNIWSLPQVNAGAELRVSRKAWINKTWLDNLGLAVPKTTEDIYNVLKAFKEQDANGNGDPNDEIPFSTGDWASLQDIFLGAFGVGTRGQHNQVVDWDTKNDRIRLIGISDEYKEMLQFMNKLYSEGLMDEEQFDMGKTWTVKQADNRVGMFGNTNLAGITMENGCEWIGLDESIEGPNGSKLWSPVRANFHSVGNAILPATCDCIPEALAWLDYFWTDEGTLFYHYGVLGDTCIDNGDGTYSYSAAVLDAMNNGASFDSAVGAISPYPGGSNPTVEVAPYFGGGEMQEPAASVARALFEYKADEIWPDFTFTEEENSVLSPIKSDVTKTINEATTQFIMGTKSFDEWDSYVDSVKNMGVDQMLKIYQAAVDRYHALMK